MAKGLKWNVYVGIIKNDGAMKVVTSVNYGNRYAHWKDGEPGEKMTLSSAKDLAWALSVNGYSAHVIQTLYELENPPAEVPTTTDEPSTIKEG